MNINRLLHYGKSTRLIGTSILTAIFLFSGTCVPAAEAAKQEGQQKDQSKITTGSGKNYQTTVERKTEGELSDQDMHQVSLLASRVVKHLNLAVQGLLDQNPEGARPEMEKALKLIKVIRDILPVTTSFTFVKDAGGKEVYSDVDKIQDDRIPLYSGMIEFNVVETVIDAKDKETTLKGLRLADANAIHTAVLADLSFIERKLNRAVALLDKPADALTQLGLAQSQGIEMIVNKADTPLVQVQQALRLSERMIEEGRQEAAKDNLRIAQVQLATYRALIGQDPGGVVKQLEDDINALMAKTGEKGASGKVRGFWERAVKLFQQEAGQAHVVKQESTAVSKQPPATEKK